MPLACLRVSLACSQAAALERLDAVRSKAQGLIIQATMYLTLRMRRYIRQVRLEALALQALHLAAGTTVAECPLWYIHFRG